MPLILARAASQNYITDTLVHAPPTTGPYAYSPPYGNWIPGQAGFPAVGATYVDPVFGSTIRRLTADNPTAGGLYTLYVKNGFWNADGTYIVQPNAAGTIVAIHSTTGAQKTLTGIGGFAADLSCSPIDADIVYYGSGNLLKQQTISGGVATTVKDFGTTLGALGGSVDWIDNTGRYFIVNLGSPSFRVWDKQTDTLYSGAITDSYDSGYIAMAPDASYVMIVCDARKKRYAIDHGTHTLTSSGTTFMGAGGDHGDFMVASDGVLYFIRANSDANPVVLEKVNVATGGVAAAYTFPPDAYWTANPAHISCTSRGANQDCAFFSTTVYGATAPDDAFNGTDPVASWGKFQSEISAVNILTGVVRRLAHTRARETALNYNNNPRLCANWDGTKVAWASNMGLASTPSGYVDLYTLNY